MNIDDKMMLLAIEQAKLGVKNNEVPVGAVLYSKNGEVIAADHNRVEEFGDPTAHAEMLVLKKSCLALETSKLHTYTLVVTLEPCAMCAQACSLARLGELRFGAYDVKSGGTVNGARVFEQSTCHHKPIIYGGLYEEESKSLLQSFFQAKRMEQRKT